jgi:VWFA-related protein
VRRRFVLAFTALALSATVISAQRAEPDVDPREQKPIFRLSVSLVQLDAVVTDGKGRHVTTLGKDDFQIFQDGRSQPITAVSYVDAAVDWHDTSGLPPLPQEATRPIDARRVIGVVVDDLRMSFESIYYARRGLGQFADRQFVPGDRALLVTTSGGYRHAPELTASAATFKAAANRLRYSMWDITAASALDAIDGVRDAFDASENFREYTFAVSALEQIEKVVDALKPLPGRKSVVLVSEGFSIGGFGVDGNYIRDAMQALVDRANRAGVVLYAIDPRGLVVTGLTAADSVGNPARLASISSMRANALRDSQDGLRYLAGETGGFAVINSNDFAGGIKRIMADQQGYYLIGYQPEEGTVGSNARFEFKRVKIKVKQRGLKVRTRSGFYNIANE